MRTHLAANGKMLHAKRMGCTWAAALILKLFNTQRAEAADRGEFKYELYKEDDKRIEVNTALLQFEGDLNPRSILRAEMVYDVISGASPTGGPPTTRHGRVPLGMVEEERTAVNFELSQRWGRQTLTPQVAFSSESDYDSCGISLNDAIEFNSRNTTLQIGASHNFDTVYAGRSPYLPSDVKYDKDVTDILIGVSQVLGPTTVVRLNGTWGASEGYLTDPYKGIRFDSFINDPNFIFGESRPSYKSREILYASAVQFIKPLNASVELAYRFYHDSWDTYAHTASLTWFQKLGKYLTVEPFVRYYDQTEAEFYYTRIPANRGNPIPLYKTPKTPKYYSADYRLSALDSWTVGVKLTVKVHERFWIDAGYKRYHMAGKDSVTASSMYPKANIITAGATLWF